jgi:hypothetical protein
MSKNSSDTVCENRPSVHLLMEDDGLFYTPEELYAHTSSHFDPQQSARLKQIWVISAISGLVVLAFVFFVSGVDYYFLPQQSSDLPARRSCSCGTSVATAKALGCKYDTLAASWLPDACRDDELAAQFDVAGPAGNWTYWADKEQTREFNIEEVAMLPSTTGCFWATQRWHLLHCSYYWRKLYRSRTTGVQMEKHYDGIGHINHCEMMFLNPGDLNAIVTEASVGLDGDKLVLPKGGCGAQTEDVD